MANLNRSFLLIALAFLTFSLSAQDIHFSQYNASPLTLNPAQTGNFNCNFRAGLNYRNQWNSVTTPFKTFSAFFDMPLPIQGFTENDDIGVGLMLFNDKSGDGNLSNFTAMVSAAYHKALGADAQHRLSLGVQMGYSQKKLDFNELIFGNQWNGDSFDPMNLPNGEPFGDNSFGNFDLNLGLMFKSAINEKIVVEGGGSIFHLTTPSESFYANPLQENDLGIRYLGHARMIYAFNDQMAVMPSFLYMNQSKAQEVTFGSDFSYYIKGGNVQATVFAGAYYRLDDAVLALAGFDYKNFRLAFSYDVNTSSLNDASSGKGGFEFSLIYKGCVLPMVPKEYVMPCPRY